MSSLWGDETGSSDYNGAETYGDGGATLQDQTQTTKTTADYLREAYGDLDEAEVVGNENLAELGAQRELLNNIGRNVDKIHSTLDTTDRRITQMENPWSVGPVMTKSSGSKGYVPTNVGTAAHTHGGSFNMEGEVLKRSQFWKKWNPRYFKQDGDVIHYYTKKGDKKPRGVMKLKGGSVCEIHYAESGRDNCFALQEAGSKTVTLIAVETNSDYNTWLSCIQREISGKKAAPKGGAKTTDFAAAAEARAAGYGTGPKPTYATFGDERENELMDGIIDKLDTLDGIGRTMGAEIEDQTRIISDMSERVAKADQRLITNSNRVRNI